MQNIDINKATELLVQLAKEHYYGDAIVELIPDIAQVFNENEQLNQTMSSILGRHHPHYPKWEDLAPEDQASIDHFFEYLYFTSPSFLGEAP